MQQLEHTQPAVTPGCKERPRPPLSHGSQITGLTGASAGSCWIQGVPWCAAAGRKPAWWVARLYTCLKFSARGSLLHSLVQN